MEPYEDQEYPWIYIENAFPEEVARNAFETCITQTKDLPQRRVKVFGKVGREPRLSQLYSTKEGHTYKYAGLEQISKPFSDIPEMQLLLDSIQEHMLKLRLPIQTFDTALVNHYRKNTQDKVGAHRDKDGVDSVIASISLGRSAKFIISKGGRGEPKRK